MTLIERLRADRIQALKDRDALKKGILSLVVSNSQLAAKESGDDNPTDAQVVTAIKKLKKGNQDLLEKVPDNEDAKKEIEILDSYLPKQLSEEELREVITNCIKTFPDGMEEGPRAIGAVMSYLKDNYAGRYDGKAASSIAKELL